MVGLTEAAIIAMGGGAWSPQAVRRSMERTSRRVRGWVAWGARRWREVHPGAEDRSLCPKRDAGNVLSEWRGASLPAPHAGPTNTGLAPRG